MEAPASPPRRAHPRRSSTTPLSRKARPGRGDLRFRGRAQPVRRLLRRLRPLLHRRRLLGNATREYAPGLTVQHKGYINGTAALEHLAATFPGATEVVVIGESAGSVAGPFYGGLAADRLPDARITVLADSLGSYSDVPRANEIMAAWGSGKAIPTWPESTGQGAEQPSFPGLFIQAGRHDPKIVFPRHDHAYDDRQEAWYALAGIPAEDLLSLIDANEAQIEEAGVKLHSYVAPGDEHVVLSEGLFYTETVNGEKLLDWVTRLIQRKAVDDVHCTECTSR
jgi:hypothetical protein